MLIFNNCKLLLQNLTSTKIFLKKSNSSSCFHLTGSAHTGQVCLPRLQHVPNIAERRCRATAETNQGVPDLSRIAQIDVQIVQQIEKENNSDQEIEEGEEK
uniref:Uncharacterized protein n=1 Tax=Cacopsylla melanoneura TaxID=428564 RepID=A0A8D9FAC2_9HEMI